METEITTDLTINFSANYSLLLKLLAPHFSRRYGYVISFIDGDEKNKLKYEVEITFLKTIPEVARLFKIDRVSSVYVNNAEPDLLIDQLAYETGKVFYPLIAEIDFDGKFIRIRNVEEIQTRWIKNREEILEYFTGEETEKYLGLMDEAIADEEYLNEVIANDMFISTYFSGIYRSYTWSLTVQENLSFPIAGKGRPVNFNVTATVAKQLNSFNAIELQHQGEANDERSALDIEEEQFFPLQKLEDPATNPVEGTYQALYILNKETKAIESVVAEWKLDLKNKKEIEVKIFEIETSASLKALNAKAPAGSELFFIDGGSTAGKEESFIEKLRKILPWQKNT